MRNFLIACMVLCFGNTLIAQTGESEFLNSKKQRVIIDSLHYDVGDFAEASGSIITMDIASFIYFPTNKLTSFNGNNITSVKVYIGDAGIGEAKIQIRYDQTSPCHYEQIFNPILGWNTIVLNTPYQIDSNQEFYLGVYYSDMMGFPAGHDAGPGDVDGNGDWIIYNDQWSHLRDLTSNGTFNWNIRAMIDGVMPTLDAKLTEIIAPNTHTTGDVNVEGTIYNRGTTPITSFDITYNINGGTESSIISFSNVNIPSNSQYTFTLPNTINFSNEGDYIINMTITNVNGTMDEIPSNNKASTNIQIFLNIIQRMVVVEEFTTEKCPNCPLAGKGLDDHLTTNPNFILMGHHAGYYTDAFTIPENTEHLEFYNKGGFTYAPAAMIDRHPINNNATTVVNSAVGTVFTNNIDSRSNEPAYLTVDLSVQRINGELEINVSGDFNKDFTDDLGVSLWITEDHIPEVNQAGADNYIHRFVTRDAISPRLGTPLTTNTNSGDSYQQSYSYTIDPTWNFDELYLVAFVNKMSSDVTKREILNAKQVRLKDHITVNLDELKTEINIFPNPAKNYININGDDLEFLKIYDLQGRLINQIDLNEHNQIDLSKVNLGTYIFSIKTRNSNIIKKVTITK